MLRTLSVSISLALAPMALAQEGRGGLFGFFGGRDIDYWAEGRLVRDPLDPASPAEASQPGSAPPLPASYSGSSLVRAGDAKPFSWKAYQDPHSVEFWDDGGDWIAPRPLREAVANPTPRNIDEYLAWQGRKAEVLGRFQAALAQRGSRPTNPSRPLVSAAVDVPWSRLEIVYFYQTSCPHCRSSREAVEEARRMGAKVTFVELDHGDSPPLHTPSIPYDQSWDETFHVTSTPTWVFRLDSRTAKHTGALGSAELRSAIAILSKQGASP